MGSRGPRQSHGPPFYLVESQGAVHTTPPHVCTEMCATFLQAERGDLDPWLAHRDQVVKRPEMGPLSHVKVIAEYCSNHAPVVLYLLWYHNK